MHYIPDDERAAIERRIVQAQAAEDVKLAAAAQAAGLTTEGLRAELGALTMYGASLDDPASIEAARIRQIRNRYGIK